MSLFFFVMYCLLFFTLSRICFFFFKQKTAYEMRISDWSSDVCSSDLIDDAVTLHQHPKRLGLIQALNERLSLTPAIDLLDREQLVEPLAVKPVFTGLLLVLDRARDILAFDPGKKLTGLRIDICAKIVVIDILLCHRGRRDSLVLPHIEKHILGRVEKNGHGLGIVLRQTIDHRRVTSKDVASFPLCVGKLPRNLRCPFEIRLCRDVTLYRLAEARAGKSDVTADAVHKAEGCRRHKRGIKQVREDIRSEERRVGTEGVSTCRSRWVTYN